VTTIRLALTDSDIQRCYPVMAQLRPHVAAPEFLQRVKTQQNSGFRLAMLEEDGQVRSVAGFRIAEMLWCGKYLYVDDLVTDETCRSKGYGGVLLDWLADHARQNGCAVLRLDSGVQRQAAHRFYFAKGMKHSCHHFVMDLK
jgi:GNAT superfamily N-acetyltransferase